MEKDDFAQWKDSYPTQWVLKRLGDEADRVEAAVKDALFSTVAGSPADWAVNQINAAEKRGYVRAMREMIDLNLEDIHDRSDNAGVSTEAVSG